ncbi:hypothetical protein B0H19DRAFT_1072763 [Mycena capillaripes]|nr:hypothetical protein B0H19DRAFT_1072763 [Mycena capillaripes]
MCGPAKGRTGGQWPGQTHDVRDRKAVAKRAANGFLTDLERFLRLLAPPDGPQKIYLTVLPVFFVNLDPAGIPTHEEDFVTDVVECAILSITGLHFAGDLPPQCGVDLWPWLWTWIDFIYAYREHLPRGLTEADVCVDLLFLVHRLSDDPAVAKLIENTRGVRKLVIRAWSLLLKRREKPDHPGYNALCDFLCRHMKASDPVNIEEIFDGAGGCEGLATLTVQQLTFFIPHRRVHLSMPTLHMLDGPLELLADLNDGDGPMNRALLSAGLVPAFTTIACAVVCPIAGIHPAQPGLEAGLLRAMARCASMKEADEHTVLWHMLSVTLPTATVYYSVVAKLPAALLDVKDLVETPAFRALPIYRHWQAFYTLAQERIRLMSDVKSKKLTSHRACDNMKCGAIAPKPDFYKYSSCQQTYYCSAECQKLDWIRGVIGRPATRCDYSGSTPALRRARFQGLRARASTFSYLKLEPLVTIFAFLGADAPSVHVTPLSDVRAQDRLEDVDWEVHVARAAASGGRMELQHPSVGARFDIKNQVVLDSTQNDRLESGKAIPRIFDISLFLAITCTATVEQECTLFSLTIQSGSFLFRHTRRTVNCDRRPG